MKNAEEFRYELWLNFVLECDPHKYSAMLENVHGSAKNVYDSVRAGDIAFTSIRMQKTVAAMKGKATEHYIDKCLEYLEKRMISVTVTGAKDYPELLSHIEDAPTILFYRGRLLPTPLPIAVIGARRCTAYGESVARSISRTLADSGACIVSGLAYGIDSIASQAALESKSDYPTVAILGSGVDVVYPKKHEKIYSQIIERGAVISEFLPGTKPNKGNFPRRNRIISGLSRGVVIIEAGERSGTSITAGYALEQGRDVFAVPGRTTDAMSIGSNRIISTGAAKMISSAADVLEEYGLEMERRAAGSKKEPDGLSKQEKGVFELLKTGEKNFDELCVLSGMQYAELNSTLTQMEFSGIIKQSPGRLYSL